MKRSIEHLNFFISHISKTLLYFDNKELTNIELVSIGLLERLKNISIQLDLTLRHLSQKPNLEFAIGISMRTLILDNLISLRFFKLLADAEKRSASKDEIEIEAKEYTNKLLSDGLAGTLTYAELIEKLNFKSKEEIGKAYNNFAIQYQNYIHPHLGMGTKPKLKFKKFSTAKELFIELADTEELRELSKIYDAYLFYSKYDHFGILYFDIIKTNKQDKLKKIRSSIELLVRHHAILHGILSHFSNEDTFLQAQHRISAEYLGSTL